MKIHRDPTTTSPSPRVSASRSPGSMVRVAWAPAERVRLARWSWNTVLDDLREKILKMLPIAAPIWSICNYQPSCTAPIVAGLGILKLLMNRKKKVGWQLDNKLRTCTAYLLRSAWAFTTYRKVFAYSRFYSPLLLILISNIFKNVFARAQSPSLSKLITHPANYSCTNKH